VEKRIFARILISCLLSPALVTAQQSLDFRLGARYSSWANSINLQTAFRSGRFQVFSRAYLTPKKNLNQYSSGVTLSFHKIMLQGFAYLTGDGTLRLNAAGALRFGGTSITASYRHFEDYGNIQVRQQLGKAFLTITGGFQRHHDFAGSVEIDIPLSIPLGHKREQKILKGEMPAPGGYQKTPLGTISGRVLDEENNPVADVLIILEDQRTVSDGNGRFVFQDIKAERSWRLTLTNIPFYLHPEKEVYEINLEANQVYEIGIFLRKK